MPGLVTARVYNSLPEAEIARSILEQHGIFAFLPDGNVAGIAWHLTFAVGGIRLQVLDSELDSARLLLDARDDALIGGGIDICPECGSGDIFRPASLVAGIVAFIFVSIPVLVRKRVRYCRKCRHKWHAVPN